MKYDAALVTGGARRLGRAMALRLAERGTRVAVHWSTSGEAASETVRQLADAGVRAVSLQADFLDDSEARGLIGRAAEGLGARIDVLVNNASIFEHDTIRSATAESWNRHMMSNFRAPFVLMQEFAAQAPEPRIDENSEPVAAAAVINMLDQRVLKPNPEFMTYTLAKLGLWNLTQVGARALAPAVRVNAIGPGPTVRGRRQSEEHFLAQRRATLLGRGGNVPDVVAALDFLLDSPSITGQLVCTDGGQHLGWRTPDVIGDART